MQGFSFPEILEKYKNGVTLLEIVQNYKFEELVLMYVTFVPLFQYSCVSCKTIFHYKTTCLFAKMRTKISITVSVR